MNRYQYGAASRAKLGTCHPHLQAVMETALALSPYDITIVHGWRGEQEQNDIFDRGMSKARFPDSRHNGTRDPLYADRADTLSDAVDFAPFMAGRGILWGETHIFAVVAGVILAAANNHGFTLRWGGDWDGDGLTSDQTLLDWGHVELIHAS